MSVARCMEVVRDLATTCEFGWGRPAYRFEGSTGLDTALLEIFTVAVGKPRAGNELDIRVNIGLSRTIKREEIDLAVS